MNVFVVLGVINHPNIVISDNISLRCRATLYLPVELQQIQTVGAHPLERAVDGSACHVKRDLTRRRYPLGEELKDNR